ncbi:helix-turn-helix domain-containing protein [Micromonospora sp. C28ISP2-4]|uniref:arsenate reductase/protein-tyrosine-phosphatase family protein n=1 Tax=Micromonospora sp. C28ISP2-4 TaxID=3059523 RepID=UPI002675A8AB|nr:helix-turn-helix domain-containing protein [Micromonospora sp. C28ISP2-4]MDO3683472.1 helix-turn-helix domain-containing protein [Micromonospora sp. C28ISP2-4]
MNVGRSSLAERARVYAALGEPARLAMADALALGDASVGEIASALDMPANLAAYHLKVLVDAGLVSKSRSEGSPRRTYLRLRPEALATLAAPRLVEVGRVVFICTYNSARSQLAAALWKRRTNGAVASAGTRPAARVHPRAMAVAHRYHLDLDPTGTAGVADVVRADDLVVAVCDSAHEELTGPMPARLHWSVPDPVRVDTDEAFEAAYVELADRVERLASAIIPGGSADWRSLSRRCPRLDR